MIKVHICVLNFKASFEKVIPPLKNEWNYDFSDDSEAKKETQWEKEKKSIKKAIFVPSETVKTYHSNRFL